MLMMELRRNLTNYSGDVTFPTINRYFLQPSPDDPSSNNS